jgi:chromatin segregation and condensation protein Rec8/ScpA/Scc1 (kleisin family)
MEETYDRIVQLVPVGKIPLSTLDDGLSRMEYVRLFILVLFLACRGLIQLWQDEDFGDIYVSLPSGVSNVTGSK